jgi:hypothetical protein
MEGTDSQSGPIPDHKADHEKCLEIFTDMWTCASPAGQMGSIYRHGHWADCAAMWIDWRRCLFAKVCSEEKKTEIYSTLNRTKRSTKDHDIWELKSIPSWKVEK